LDQFLKYYIEILLQDFSANVGREDIFKPTIGNEILHGSINDSEVRVVNLVISKNVSRVQCSNSLGLLMMGKHTPTFITS
jgi:hypothetical protein